MALLLTDDVVERILLRSEHAERLDLQSRLQARG